MKNQLCKYVLTNKGNIREPINVEEDENGIFLVFSKFVGDIKIINSEKVIATSDNVSDLQKEWKRQCQKILK